MKHIVFAERPDGFNYHIIDSDLPVVAIVGRFKTLEDAGTVVRYISGLTMTVKERETALNAIRDYDQTIQSIKAKREKNRLKRQRRKARNAIRQKPRSSTAL